MKVDVAMFGEKTGDLEAPAVPQPVYRLVQWMVQTMSVVMRTFGISELRLELVQSGVIPVSVIKFQPMADMDVPKELADIRLELIRGMLLTAMERFGIGTLKLTLSDAEKDELRGYWSYLRTGTQSKAPEAAKSEDIVFENIPLPVETDPAPAEQPPAANTASMASGNAT